MPGNLYRLHLTTETHVGSRVHNSHYVASYASAGATAILANWLTNCHDHYVAMLPTSYTYESMEVTRIFPHGDISAEVAVDAAPIAGSATTDGGELAEWLVCRCTVKSGLRSRKYRGALLFAGGVQHDVDGDLLIDASDRWMGRIRVYVASIQANFDDGESVGQLSVFSPSIWRAGGGDPTTWSKPVTLIDVHRSMRSLRTRRVISS